MKDVRSIVKEAGCDFVKIRNAYGVLSSQHDVMFNLNTIFPSFFSKYYLQGYFIFWQLPSAQKKDLTQYKSNPFHQRLLFIAAILYKNVLMHLLNLYIIVIMFFTFLKISYYC